MSIRAAFSIGVIAVVLIASYYAFTATDPTVTSILSRTVKVLPAHLAFSSVAQNFAQPQFDAAHGYERSLANPTLTQLTVGGVPYVYMLIRAERATERGTRLLLARIPAAQFSDGTAVTPFAKWEQ